MAFGIRHLVFGWEGADEGAVLELPAVVEAAADEDALLGGRSAVGVATGLGGRVADSVFGERGAWPERSPRTDVASG